MPSQRPGSVLTAAVLAIIYGAQFMICGLCGMVGLAAQGAGGFMGGANPQQAQIQKQLEDALERDVPAYRITQVVMPILTLAEALAMLVGGIGLLGMRSWARVLTLATAAITIVSTILQVVYQVVFVMPATNDALGGAINAAVPKGPGPGADIARMTQMMVPVIAVLSIAFFVLIIVYLVVIVLLLVGQKARAAFAGLPTESAAPDGDEADEGWGRSVPPPNPEDQGLYR